MTVLAMLGLVVLAVLVGVWLLPRGQARVERPRQQQRRRIGWIMAPLREDPPSRTLERTANGHGSDRREGRLLSARTTQRAPGGADAEARELGEVLRRAREIEEARLWGSGARAR